MQAVESNPGSRPGNDHYSTVEETNVQEEEVTGPGVSTDADSLMRESLKRGRAFLLALRDSCRMDVTK